MTEKKTLDDCLSTRNGHLFVEACDSIELVHQFGSPLFVMSEDQIRRNVRRFQAAFQSGWPNGTVKVLPAAKANWIPAVQRILADEGCGCDIYSPGELSIALDSGFPPELISVNGVPKDEEHVYRGIQRGCRITIDSVEEVDFIERYGCESSQLYPGLSNIPILLQKGWCPRILQRWCTREGSPLTTQWKQVNGCSVWKM